MLSVITHPNYTYGYTDQSAVNEIPNIIVNTLTSLATSNGVSMPLTLGASDNVNIETECNVRMYMANSGMFQLYKSLYDSNTDVRTDTQFFQMGYNSSSLVTNISVPNSINIQSDDPLNSTYQIGTLIMSQVAGKQVFDSTNAEGYWFTDKATFDGDVTVGNNLFTVGNVYGNSLNVWQTRTYSNLDKVGYGMMINEKDQLEFVKYARYYNSNGTFKNVAKRVAVFGLNQLNSNDSNDASFLTFDALNGVSLSNQNGSLALTSAIAAIGCNMQLIGATTADGSIIPQSNDKYTLGTNAKRWSDLYVDSNGAIFLGGAELTNINSSNLAISGGLTTTGSIIPSQSGTYTLGSPTNTWGDVYMGAANTFTLGAAAFSNSESSNISFSGGMIMNGHLLPLSNLVFDIGSPTLRWRDLYISGNSIYMGSNVVSVEENGNFKFTSSNGELTSTICKEVYIQDPSSGNMGKIKMDASSGSFKFFKVDSNGQETPDGDLGAGSLSNEVVTLKATVSNLRRSVTNDGQIVSASNGTSSDPSIRIGSANSNLGLFAHQSNQIGFAVNGSTAMSVGESSVQITSNVSVGGSMSSSILAASNGTVSDPSIRFGSAANSNLGIYAQSATEIGFSVAGANAMTVGAAGVQVTQNLVVSGSLTVSGTTTTLNTSNLNVTDNLITINNGLSNGLNPYPLSGIEVRRGADSNYYFVFDEVTDLFKVGTSNDLQAVCTRVDNLTSGFPYFDSASNKLIARSIAMSDVTGLTSLSNSTSNLSSSFTTLSNATFSLSNSTSNLSASFTTLSNSTNTLSNNFVSLSNTTASLSNSTSNLTVTVASLSNTVQNLVQNGGGGGGGGTVTGLALSNDRVYVPTLGTADLPAYSFCNSTDMGMFAASSNELGFSCLGSNLMKLSKSNLQVAVPLVSGGIVLTRATTIADMSNAISDINKVATSADVTGLSNQFTTLSNTVQTFLNNGAGGYFAPAVGSNGNIYFSTSSNNNFVGIGTSNPNYKLEVNGDIYATQDILAFSDYRCKKDFQLIDEPLYKVCQLNGYTYSRSDSEDPRRYVGLIAQEVQEVIPEAVQERGDGFLSLAYGNLAALFVESIKVIKQRLDALEQRLVVA